MEEILEIFRDGLAVVPPGLPIHARCRFLLQTEVSHRQRVQVVDVVQVRSEPQPLVLSCCLTYPLQRAEGVVPARCPYAAEYPARTLPYQRFDAALAGGSA